jgi:ATP-dependent protease ClpP protease subunit
MSDKPNKDVVYAKPLAFEFTYYLSDIVQDSHEYHEFLQLLDTATENDTIRIIINNYGGEAGTCVQIVNTIRECKGHVIGVLAGEACSAAGIIFMACHSQEVGQHTMLMIHQAIGGNYGKLSDAPSRIQAELARTKSLYNDVFEFFLTQEEIDAVLEGKDFWLNDPEIISRLESRAEKLQKQHKEAVDKAQQDFLASMEAEDLPEAILKKLSKLQLIAYIQGDIIVEVGEDGETFEIIEIEDEEPPKLH